MNFNLLSMKSIFSCALKAQTQWKSLRPAQLARLCSDFPGQQLKDDHTTHNQLTEDSLRQPINEKSINEVKLLGRITREPEVCKEGDMTYLKFPLATLHRKVNRETGEVNEETYCHDVIVTHPKRIESIERFLKKGNRIYVDGKLTYDTTADGAKSCRIVLRQFVTLR